MIYLDYAAATPVSEKVLREMEPYFTTKFFNPSAPYLPALEVRKEFEAAKGEIAHMIGAKGADLIMTSGATEATNLAFSVVQNHNAEEQRSDFSVPRDCAPGRSPVLYLETEHDSVRQIAKRYGGVEIKVKRTGVIDLDDFRRKLSEKVRLVSIALVNNEIGTIQPIAEIAEIIKKERLRRAKMEIRTPIYFHTDAAQALNLLDINVSRLRVDLMTISAAKIYGPKGVGALYVQHGVRLSPAIYGGGQERGLRSGTENVPGVVGFAVAAKEAKKHNNGNRKKFEKLSRILREELEKSEVEPLFLGNKRRQLANFVPVVFSGLDAERLIYKLEDKGVYLSTGAACAASKGQKSHVLEALGLSSAEIQGSLRITLGAQNTEEEMHEAGWLIREAISEEVKRQKIG